MGSPQNPDDKILHQGDVEDVVDDLVSGEVTSITNAVVAHSFNATFNHTEIESACNALGTKINAILAALKTNPNP